MKLPLSMMSECSIGCFSMKKWPFSFFWQNEFFPIRMVWREGMDSVKEKFLFFETQ